MGKGSCGAPILTIKVVWGNKRPPEQPAKALKRMLPQSCAGCFVMSCLVKAAAIKIGVKETKEHHHEITLRPGNQAHAKIKV